jgi:hypothetical protein
MAETDIAELQAQVGHSDSRVTEMAIFLNQQLTNANKKMNGFGQQVA